MLSVLVSTDPICICAVMCTKLTHCLQSMLPNHFGSHWSLACSFVASAQQKHLSPSFIDDTRGFCSPSHAFTFPPFLRVMLFPFHLCSLSCVQIEALILSANSNLTLEEIEDTFQFPLDGFQKQAVSHFLEGNSVLVCAPTGAGKTAIAEAAAVAVLARSALLYSL